MIKTVFNLAAPFFLLGSALFGAPCVVGSLQSYIDGGSCSVGGIQFSSFTTEPGIFGATVIDPANVQVIPGGMPMQALLQLNLNETVGAGDLLDLLFRVKATGLLTGASVSLGSASVFGDAAVTAILDVCSDGEFAGPGPTGCTGMSASAVAFAVEGLSESSARVDFAAPSFFDIFFNVTLDGGLTGSATLDSATLEVNAIPEPSAMLLVAIGLGAIGLRRRVFRNVVSRKKVGETQCN